MLWLTISLWITAGVVQLSDCLQVNSFDCSQITNWFVDLDGNGGYNSSIIPAQHVICCKDDIACGDVTTILHDVTLRARWTNVLFIRSRTHGSAHFHRTVLGTLSDLHIGAVHLTIEEDDGTEAAAKVNQTKTFPPLTTSQLSLTTIPQLVVCVSPPFVITIMKEALALQMLTSRYQWLILCPVDTETTASLATLLPQDSNVLLMHTDVWDATSARTKEKAWDETIGLMAWKSHPVGQFTLLSSWQLREGWTMPLPESLFPNVFTDFGNRLLRIGTIPAKPFVTRRKEGNVTTYDGFCIELLRTMAAQLNFRYELYESPDGKYGALTDNGSWNGMVGMVSRKEVDMAVGPYTITSARETVVDFSVPFMEDGGGILTKRDQSTASWMAGLGTFSSTVWFSLIGTILAVGFAFYVVVRFSPYSADTMHVGTDKGRYWHLWSCVMHICGSCMMQGMERLPTSLSARCMLGFWWVFSILIISTYTATLASMLTVEKEGTKIDSIDDLALSSVKPLVLSGAMWESLFQSAEAGVYKQIRDRMFDMPAVTEDEMALQFVLTEERAFLHDINNVRFMQGQHCKELYLAKTIFSSNGLGLILPEKAPFRDAVNDVLLRMHEGGFLEKWRSQWWHVNADCETQSSGSVSEAKHLGLSKMVGLLLVYGAVVTASVICFLVMQCLHKTEIGQRVVKGCRRLLLVSAKENMAAAARVADVNVQPREDLTSE